MRSPSRRRAPEDDPPASAADFVKFQLQFAWWMLTEDYTIMAYALFMILVFVFLVIFGLAAG
jgi:hypothetical protein